MIHTAVRYLAMLSFVASCCTDDMDELPTLVKLIGMLRQDDEAPSPFDAPRLSTCTTVSSPHVMKTSNRSTSSNNNDSGMSAPHSQAQHRSSVTSLPLYDAAVAKSSGILCMLKFLLTCSEDTERESFPFLRQLITVEDAEGVDDDAAEAVEADSKQLSPSMACTSYADTAVVWPSTLASAHEDMLLFEAQPTGLPLEAAHASEPTRPATTRSQTSHPAEQQGGTEHPPQGRAQEVDKLHGTQTGDQIAPKEEDFAAVDSVTKTTPNDSAPAVDLAAATTATKTPHPPVRLRNPHNTRMPQHNSVAGVNDGGYYPDVMSMDVVSDLREYLRQRAVRPHMVANTILDRGARNAAIGVPAARLRASQSRYVQRYRHRLYGTPVPYSDAQSRSVSRTNLPRNRDIGSDASHSIKESSCRRSISNNGYHDNSNHKDTPLLIHATELSAGDGRSGKRSTAEVEHDGHASPLRTLWREQLALQNRVRRKLLSRFPVEYFADTRRDQVLPLSLRRQSGWTTEEGVACDDANAAGLLEPARPADVGHEEVTMQSGGTSATKRLRHRTRNTSPTYRGDESSRIAPGGGSSYSNSGGGGAHSLYRECQVVSGEDVARCAPTLRAMEPANVGRADTTTHRMPMPNLHSTREGSEAAFSLTPRSQSLQRRRATQTRHSSAPQMAVGLFSEAVRQPRASTRRGVSVTTRQTVLPPPRRTSFAPRHALPAPQQHSRGRGDAVRNAEAQDLTVIGKHIHLMAPHPRQRRG